MSLKDRIDLWEDDSRIVEKIAKQYGEKSKEYATLKRALIALWYVSVEEYKEFNEYLVKFKSDLNPIERASLAKMGIDPDAI